MIGKRPGNALVDAAVAPEEDAPAVSGAGACTTGTNIGKPVAGAGAAEESLEFAVDAAAAACCTNAANGFAAAGSPEPDAAAAAAAALAGTTAMYPAGAPAPETGIASCIMFIGTYTGCGIVGVVCGREDVEL